MEDNDRRPAQPDQGETNTRQGPTDQGGHGGMATREQEAQQTDATERIEESVEQEQAGDDAEVEPPD